MSSCSDSDLVMGLHGTERSAVTCVLVCSGVRQSGLWHGTEWTVLSPCQGELNMVLSELSSARCAAG